jgi:hypothetical protein
VLRRGVTEQNKQQIADELSSAGRVQFRMGAGSFKWREVLHTFRTPVIQRAVSGGLQQASSNTLDYGINGENRNLGGYVHAFGSGFATGAAGSVFAGRRTSAAPGERSGRRLSSRRARQRGHGPGGQPRCRSGTVRGQRSRATQR